MGWLFLQVTNSCLDVFFFLCVVGTKRRYFVYHHFWVLLLVINFCNTTWTTVWLSFKNLRSWIIVGWDIVWLIWYIYEVFFRFRHTYVVWYSLCLVHFTTLTHFNLTRSILQCFTVYSWFCKIPRKNLFLGLNHRIVKSRARLHHVY